MGISRRLKHGNGNGGFSLESPFQLEKVEGRQVEAFSPGAAVVLPPLLLLFFCNSTTAECFSSFHLLVH